MYLTLGSFSLLTSTAFAGYALHYNTNTSSILIAVGEFPIWPFLLALFELLFACSIPCIVSPHSYHYGSGVTGLESKYELYKSVFPGSCRA